jgi:hypothetical protein
MATLILPATRTGAFNAQNQSAEYRRMDQSTPLKATESMSGSSSSSEAPDATETHWNYFHTAHWRWGEIYPKSRVVIDVHEAFLDVAGLIAKYSPDIHQASAETKELAQ